MATSKTMSCVDGSRQEDGERGCLGRKRCCVGTGKEDREQVITHKVKVGRTMLIVMQEGEWGIKLSMSRASLDQTGLELGPRVFWVQLGGCIANLVATFSSSLPQGRFSSSAEGINPQASPPGSLFSLSPAPHVPSEPPRVSIRVSSSAHRACEAATLTQAAGTFPLSSSLVQPRHHCLMGFQKHRSAQEQTALSKLTMSPCSL